MNTNVVTVSALDDLMSVEKVLLIDLRDSLSYRCSHLPTAINVQPSRVNMLLANLNKRLRIVLYCDFGDDSLEIAELFREFGFNRCQSLSGGYEEWLLQRMRHAKMTEGLCQWLASNGYDCNDLEKKGFNGETALLFAARRGRTDYLVEIIDRGANIEARNNDGNSAVWLACYSNDIHALNELIRSGANLDIQNDNGASPLIYSASAGRAVMVKRLLEAGANPQLTTLDDFSALDVASTLPILRMLRKVTNNSQQFACQEGR